MILTPVAPNAFGVAQFFGIWINFLTAFIAGYFDALINLCHVKNPPLSMRSLPCAEDGRWKNSLRVPTFQRGF
jgi:hypothetical protein